MIEIKLEELKSWILSQPNDKEVRMHQTTYNSCGCVMVQYGKEKGIDFDYVSSISFTKDHDWVATMDRQIYELFDGNWSKATNCITYGKLKKQLV